MMTHRHPAGTPSGGQFAPGQRDEADMNAIQIDEDGAPYRAARVDADRVREIPSNAGKLSYTDHAADNAVRARFAANALHQYAQTTGMLDEEPETTISDLVGDLRHLCDSLGLDFDEVAGNGTWHYEAEIRGEL